MESGTRRRVSLRAGTGRLSGHKSESRAEDALVYKLILCQQLVQGEAEVFGAELALGRTYLFGAECKAAVFTWHGCTLEMS
jgi:N-terminal beta-sandwich domain of polyadenylation factor